MHEPIDIDIDSRAVCRIFDCSPAYVARLVEDGDLTPTGEDSFSIEDCESLAQRRGTPSLHQVRALSVLDRMKTVYTTGDVAKVLGCSPDLVIKLIDTNALEGYRLPNTGPAPHGGDRRVTKAALVEYLAKSPCAQAGPMGMRPKGKADATSKGTKAGRK